MKKFGIVMIAFMLLFVSFGASVAADGSDYFRSQRIYGTDCYNVPISEQDYYVNYGEYFLLPVSLYEGYEATFKALSVVFNSKEGLRADAGEEIADIYEKIWYNDDYGSACLYDKDIADVDDFWAYAEWDYEEPWPTIYDSLPEWACNMKWAISEITDYLAEMYDLAHGNSWADSLDEIYDDYGEDLEEALDFVNVYFPDIKFYAY